MKSFKHFYNYVKLTGFDLESAQGRPSSIICRGIAPKEMPHHIAAFLITRIAKRWYLKWPKPSRFTVDE